MTVIEDCTVYYSDGNTTKGTDVLFKENGWVRTGTNGAYTYHPPQNIERIEFER